MSELKKRRRPDSISSGTLSVSEAAAVLGRSPSWVRDRLTDNQLEAVSKSEKRGTAITIKSVLALLKRKRSERKLQVERPWLRLVVDNDPK